jgi:hypothetical protein
MTVYQPQGVIPTGRAKDYIPLPATDKPVKERSPTVQHIFQGYLAKYQNPPSCPMSMASGSLAFLANPTASRATWELQQKEDLPDLEDGGSRIGNVNS